MSTNKIALKSVEQVQQDYQPIYRPIFGLFLGKSQQYDEKVGKQDFRRIEAVGDIRGKRYTPKDTHIHQIAATESTKTFKKYFDPSQFILSQFQDEQGVQEVITQVLDEHNAQFDERLLMGEGTTPGTQLNNGLYLSSDSNYTLEGSAEIAKGTDETHLSDMHTKVVATAHKADQVAGRKLIMFYGNVVPKFNSLYAGSQRAFKEALAAVLGPDYTFATMPDEITPSGANGWIVANLDQSKLHYMTLPKLLASGHDEKAMELWFNFLQGSCMLEVLTKHGVIRQPTTLAA